MRYPPDRKQQSRQKVAQAAFETFNERGIEGAGIAEIMKRAGLTQGAFSRHFSSKEELVREAIDEGFNQLPFMPPELSHKSLEFLIRRYLAAGHRDYVARSCPSGALTAEVARHPLETRQVFIAQLKTQFAALNAKLLSRKKGAARRRRIMAIFALLMGSLEMARLTKDTELSDQMLQAGIEAALALITD